MIAAASSAASRDPLLRRLPPLLAAAGALLLEGKAIREFLSAPEAGAPLPLLLALHLSACALFASAFRPREGGWWKSLAAFAFVFSLALPGLGMAGILLGVLPALGPRGRERGPRYGILRRGPLRIAVPVYPVRHGPGGFRARLLARGIPASERLGSVLALRRRPTPRGNRLLKEMLRDPSDELRLAAYAALERLERDSQAAIAAARAAADAGRDRNARLAALRRLAFLEWEAAYQELADGEVTRHHLEQALHAAEEASALDPGDGFLASLKGRILARMGAWEDAHRAFAAAGGEDGGAAAARLLPHRAELAFQRRDFASVRSHLSALRGHARGGPLEPVLRFWLGREG